MENQLLTCVDVENASVYSFDVFDTVLTRAVSPPSAIFLFVGQQAANLLRGCCSPPQFAYVREQAEMRAYEWHGAGTSLEDIYRQVREILDLSEEQAQQLRRLEVEVEGKVVYAVPEVRAAIKDLRSRGMSIAYTSDMYLSSDQIKEWLIQHEIWRPEDHLVVSCEHDALKYNGRLFQPLIDMYNSPEKVVHVGNNQEADIDGARVANTRPCHFTKANPNRYEQILEKHARNTGGMSALLAGASRYARLLTEVTSPREKALRDVAAGVMAPVLTGFVVWILQQARERGLNRLYFTSRDGYMLLPIARALAPLLNDMLEVRYLYLSRVAITAAYPDPTAISETWDSFERASGVELLGRLGLKMEDIAPYLPSEQARREIICKPITERGKVALQEVLSRIKQGSPLQQDVISRNRRLLCSYLEQEGLADSSDYGIIDIGWKGTIHGLLNEVLIEEEMIARPIPGFYFGLNVDQQVHADHRTAYFFDKHRKSGQVDPLPRGAHATVMEMFCTADHGTVTGYRKNKSKVEPTLESTWGERVSGWGFPVVQRTIQRYVQGIVQNIGYISDNDIRSPLAEVLRTFWTSPEFREAVAWGDFPRETGQGEETATRPLAEPYDIQALASFARYGPHAQNVLNGYPSWPEGSLARSAPEVRRCIRSILRARKIVKHGVRAIKRI